MAAGSAPSDGLTAYGIVKRKFFAAAFSGEGARLYGGRWNSPGTLAVYTSGTISLALLEWRAHLAQWPAPAVGIIKIEFDAGLVWAPARLPATWKQTPSPKTNLALGDEWARSGRSAVLRVPSAIVPEESNYLLNPAHPDFKQIRIGKLRLLKVDPRITAGPGLNP